MQLSDLDLLENDQTSKIDFQKIYHKIKVNWLYCLLSAFILIGLAGVFLYLSNSTYNTVASVLIKDNNGQSGTQQNSGIASLQNLGLLPGASNVDNEREIIISYPLLLQVVNDLQLYLYFNTYSNFKEEQLYGDKLPFKVTITELTTDTLTDDQLNYVITINDKGYSIVSNDSTWTSNWGDTVNLPVGNVILDKTNTTKTWDSSKPINLLVSNKAVVADFYQRIIEADISNKQTSIIELSLPTKVPQKGIDFLNHLIDVYQLSNIDDNNRIIDSTIKFINSRLELVGGELDSIEGNIQQFKQDNDLADLSAQSQVLITSAGIYSQNRAEQEVQLSVINSLIRYMNDNISNNRIVPASLTIDDKSVNGIIENYNLLLLQKERLLLSSTLDNPYVQNLDNQLVGLRKDMMAGLNSIKLAIQSGLSQMKQNSGEMESKIRQVPAKERIFVEYSRQQSIKQELYLFLLQKREESLISKSSTVSNARIIVPGRAEDKPLGPNKKLILVLAFVVGISLPFIIATIRSLTNVKIRTKRDIENGTKVPILSEIFHGDSVIGDVLNIKATSRDPLAEQFRILRTDLNFLLPNPVDKVILFTSSMPNEGKSFVSLNLSAMMAFSGKKVIVLEMDLRKPKLSQRLELKSNKGFSHYAIGQATIDEIIYSVPDNPNLFIIPSGPIPPNPAELIILDKTSLLFATLRERYDYIIIDTTPCIVADARLLARYADVTLYLIRIDVTYKDQLTQINKFWKDEKFPRLNLIVNDVNNRKKQGYYGYGQYSAYGYGYGYGYFGEKEIKKNKKRLKK